MEMKCFLCLAARGRETGDLAPSQLAWPGPGSFLPGPLSGLPKGGRREAGRGLLRARSPKRLWLHFGCEPVVPPHHLGFASQSWECSRVLDPDSPGAADSLCDLAAVTAPLCASVFKKELGTAAVFLKADAAHPAWESLQRACRKCRFLGSGHKIKPCGAAQESAPWQALQGTQGRLEAFQTLGRIVSTRLLLSLTFWAFPPWRRDFW